jgi:hypothetical protein
LEWKRGEEGGEYIPGGYFEAGGIFGHPNNLDTLEKKVAAKMDGWMIFGVLLGFLRISSANSAPVTSYFTLSLSLCVLSGLSVSSELAS